MLRWAGVYTLDSLWRWIPVPVVAIGREPGQVRKEAAAAALSGAAARLVEAASPVRIEASLFEMSYQVLARKWRPKRFDEVVGQEHVVRALANGLRTNRLHHAFLFTGTRGTGKTTIARILARCLNCETGVTDEPCGSCVSCTEIDQGRFMDLIEVDAASRTRVDDTRELLDNVQYAPARGRYKVYLIDEVHMLSGHSFNALLKTLEEPPPHVKFLLATTDPQKLPVTVLSRCLQFNLRRVPAALIRQRLADILRREELPFEEGALKWIADAADGSVRDALSLLDQALAFTGGPLVENLVREMLGAIDQQTVTRLMEALANQNSRELLAAIADVAPFSPDYDALLKEVLAALHAVAMEQQVPGAARDLDGPMFDAARFAARLPPEDVQLFYHIGVGGRRDLPFAPDARSGAEITLLRMLAFRPVAGSGLGVPQVVVEATAMARVPVAPPAQMAATAAVAAPVRALDQLPGAWSQVVGELAVSGLVRELLVNSTPVHEGGARLKLLLDPKFQHLGAKERVVLAQTAVAAYYGEPVILELQVAGNDLSTPARVRRAEQEQRQQSAAEEIFSDPIVKAMQDQFGARVDPLSIKPKP